LSRDPERASFGGTPLYAYTITLYD